MQLDLRVNGTTKLTGLIGNPVEHTVSPVLQNSLFSAAGINGIYVPLRIPEGCLANAVNGLKAAGFTGFNVTIPYKQEIMRYLDEISDEARILGAVNTVKISGGNLIGDNTDGDGFIRAFTEQTGSDISGKSICVLGAGGTARALSIKAALVGARRICIINRTVSRADELAEKVNQIMLQKGCAKKTAFSAVMGSHDAMVALLECDVIINTTSVGMHPYPDASPLEDSFPFRENQIIYDVIYNPSQTKLTALATQRGCTAVNGAGMLFYQGVKAFEIWIGHAVCEDILDNLSTEFLKYLVV